MNYRLEITENAEALLDNILKYIINNLINPQAAKNLIDTIEVLYHNLETNPQMYAYLEDPLIEKTVYRKVVIPRYDYVMIFRIDEETKTVYILGYFHDLERYIRKL